MENNIGNISFLVVLVLSVDVEVLMMVLMIVLMMVLSSMFLINYMELVCVVEYNFVLVVVIVVMILFFFFVGFIIGFFKWCILFVEDDVDFDV